MNLAAIIEPHPAESTALIESGNRLTYGEMRERVERTAGGLLATGLEVGDRVAIVLPTGIDFVVTYLAVLRAGLVAVPLNPQSPAPEMARELATVSPALLVGASTAPGVRAVRPDELSNGAPAPLADRDEKDPAVLLFTSGTAGFPKAAVLTHGSLHANLQQMEMRAGIASSDDVGILLIPIFHIFGLNAVLDLHLFVGASLVLVDRFDAVESLALIRDLGVTTVAAVPSVFAIWAALPAAKGDEFASARLVLSGAAALPEDVARAFVARFGVPLYQGYGLTEASPAVSFPDPSEPARKGSVGAPLPGVEVRIVDSDSQSVVPGDPGELLVRGPNVFAGYYEDEGASKAVLDRAGWLHTGDVAVMAEDGTIALVDRSKDLIIVSGFNVYPAEVEEVLREHPDVVDVAVVGVPDAVTGEAVRAFVVPLGEKWPADADEPLTGLAEDLAAHCAVNLARYKCPAQISFVREMPRGLVGDPLRRALR